MGRAVTVTLFSHCIYFLIIALLLSLYPMMMMLLLLFIVVIVVVVRVVSRFQKQRKQGYLMLAL